MQRVDPGDLSRVVLESDRVVVVAGHEFDPDHRKRNEVLADVREPDLDSLVAALTLGDGERMAWMRLGDPSLAFLRGRSLVAVVQCLLPGYVRCDEIWQGDAPLQDSRALERWLADVGARPADSHHATTIEDR